EALPVGLDEDFSAERFRALDPSNPVPTVEIILRLEEEVGAEIHAVVKQKLEEVAARLNGTGHRLVLDVDAVGEVSYHDDTDPPDGTHCWLRISADTTVS